MQRIFVNGNESPKKTKDREAVFTWDTFDRNVINSVISEFHNKGIFPTMRDIWWPTGRGVSDGSRRARKLRLVSFDSAHQA